MFNSLRSKIAGGAALAFVSVGSAFAAVPAGVTTAINDMQTDGLAVAALVLVAFIAVHAVKFIRKAM